MAFSLDWNLFETHLHFISTVAVGVAYILDEPSIGLHQRDNDKLLRALMRLRDLGNSLIVVEHDEDTMRAADCIVDIGPGAGEHGDAKIFLKTFFLCLRGCRKREECIQQIKDLQITLFICIT